MPEIENIMLLFWGRMGSLKYGIAATKTAKESILEIKEQQI